MKVKRDNRLIARINDNNQNMIYKLCEVENLSVSDLIRKLIHEDESVHIVKQDMRSDNIIAVCLTEEELWKVNEKIKLLGVTKSTYIRNLIIERYKTIDRK